MNMTSTTKHIKAKFISDIKEEFADYDDMELDGIEIPPGFISAAWHNDTCPSIINETSGYKIFIDYKEPWHRENSTLLRFSLYKYNSSTDEFDFNFESDNWFEILAAL